MTLAEAILRFRKQLAMTQPQFSTALGNVSLRSLCRFEKGETPSVKGLMALADLAKAKKLDHFHAIFSALLQGDLVAQGDVRRQNLRSPGSARRVDFQQLMRWAQAADDVVETHKSIGKRIHLKVTPPAETDSESLLITLKSIAESMRTSNDAARTIRDEVLLYVLGEGSDSFDREDAVDCVLHPQKRGPKKSRELIDKYIAGPGRQQNTKRLNENIQLLKKQFVPTAKKARKPRKP